MTSPSSVVSPHRTARNCSRGTGRADDPWASLLLVHGLGEHSGRYEHVGEHLAAAGIDAHAYDHRGNGGKRRGPGRHRSMEPVTTTTSKNGWCRLRAERRRPARRPVWPLPGRARRRRLPDRRPAAARLHRAVRARPRLDPGQMEARLAPVLARVAPSLSLPRHPRRDALARPRGGRRVRSDPLNITSNTLRFGAEALGERKRVRAGRAIDRRADARAPRPRRRPRPPSASEVFEGAPGVERRTYPGLRHELHNEPEGPEVVDDVIAWLTPACYGSRHN